MQRRSIAEHSRDPLILEGIRRLSKDREDVAEALRQRCIYLILDRPGVPEVQNVDVVADLPDVPGPTLPLLKP